MSSFERAYIQVRFKIVNYSLSGISITPDNVSTTPPSRIHTITITKEVIGNNCKIWNSRGDVKLRQVSFI